MPRSRGTRRTKLGKISCFFNFTGLFVTLMGLFVTLLGVTQHFKLKLHIIGPIIMGSGSLIFVVGMLIWLQIRRSSRNERVALRQVEDEFQRHMHNRNGHNANCSFYREKAQSRVTSRSSTPSHLSSRSPEVANHRRAEICDGNVHSPTKPIMLPDDCVWLTHDADSPQYFKVDHNFNFYPCLV